MEALLSVGGGLGRGPLDRELVSGLWWMCRLARAWGGLHPGGMLQRNRLITPADAARLGEWVDIVEDTTLALLDGRPADYALHDYAR